ncbi:hypothetical protein JNUCC0626_18195 [Lentzea sp. JNUCC 0626]|uniref:hypothetical protein n=1 Tax=Lentzea sp. JNUCC 0626 TaxID=3367513 RepID=UPI003748F1AD
MSATRYIATQDIYAAPFVRAYRKGDEVPASAVETLACQDKVASERGKATATTAKTTAKDA